MAVKGAVMMPALGWLAALALAACIAPGQGGRVEGLTPPTIGSAAIPQSVLHPPTPPPVAQHSPEAAVRKLLDAVMTLDVQQYQAALDPAVRDRPSIAFTGDVFLQVLTEAGWGGGEASGGPNLSLQYVTSGNDGMTATVSVYGSLIGGSPGAPAIRQAFFVRNIGGLWYVTIPAAAASWTPAPTAPPPPPISLLAFDYHLVDAGGGWKEGTVQLAFQNTSGDYAAGFVADLSGAQVETLEGEAYSATLYKQSPRMWRGAYGEPTTRVDFGSLPAVIPPGFCWRQVGEDEWGYYYLQFRSATAANPLRVVFPAKPEWEIDLEAAGRPMPMFPAEPFILEEIARPMTELGKETLADDAEGLLVQLEGAARQTGEYAELLYSAENRDQFHTQRISFSSPFTTYFLANGAIVYRPSETHSIELGPGQKATHKQLFQVHLLSDRSCARDAIALWEAKDGAHKLYRLNLCDE